MKVVILRSSSGSLFITKEDDDILSVIPLEPILYDVTAEGIANFYQEVIAKEIQERNVFRNEYCAEHGIPATDKGRLLKAARYIREHTQPLLILIENLADLCQPGLPAEYMDNLKTIISRGKGYNIYFIGATYPEGYSILNNNSILTTFCEEQFLLLYGGRYSRQCMTQLSSGNAKSMSKPVPEYNRCLMKYREEFYRLLMPCGVIRQEEADPDEASIV